MKVRGLNHITIGVSDLEKSKRFYRDILGFKELGRDRENDCHFTVGDTWFVLVQDPEARPAQGYGHLAFSVDKSDFKEVSDKIIGSGSQIWQDSQTTGESLYFLDPDGQKLEIHSSSWKHRSLK